MSDTTSTLSQVTGLLSAAAVPSSAVAAVADVILETEKIAAPFITQKLLTSDDDLVQSQIAEAVQLFSAPDSPAAEQSLGDFYSGLCINAGLPVSGGVGPVALRGVRVEYLLASATALIKLARYEKLFGQLAEQSAKGKQSS